MPSITSAGIGSGLDIESLVAQLVDAERAPQTSRLNTAQSRVQTQLSAMGSYRSALASFESALESIGSGTAFGKQSVTSADATALTGTADGTAAAGTYAVEVVSLAYAHKLGSQAYAGSTSTVGTGTLTIAVGEDSFSINIADGANSLAAIRDAINNAVDNTGVRATVVTSSDGAHLVLSAKESGTAHALTVTQSGGDGGLAALVYDPGTATALTELQEAFNAAVRVDTYLFESSTNSISGAIEGVTLNLAKAQPGQSVDLSVAADNKAVTDAINGFVLAYNTLTATIAKLTKYDAATQTAAPLLGDPALQAASMQLRRMAGAQVSGNAFGTLAAIGITTKTDGSLTVDGSKLAASLSGDLASVKSLFSGSGGIGAQLHTAVESYLDTDGPVQARTDGAERKLKDIQKQRDALTLRMDALEKRYRLQFSALDMLVSQLQSTSSYLTAQLASLAALTNGTSS